MKNLDSIHSGIEKELSHSDYVLKEIENGLVRIFDNKDMEYYVLRLTKTNRVKKNSLSSENR